MRFAEADSSSGYLIEGYDPDGVRIAGRHYGRSLMLTASEIVEDWGPPSPAELTRAHLEALLAAEPQVIVLGTGARQVFPDPEVYVWVMAQRVGVEIMDTGAACRTYNILVAEGRRVAAGLIIG